jgi:hypothetical protein
MNTKLLQFASVLFAALALVPAGAHLLELKHKIALPGNEYLVVQQLYRGWNLAGTGPCCRRTGRSCARAGSIRMRRARC